MSLLNTLSPIAQVTPALSIIAPVPVNDLKNNEDFKTLNFLSENATIFNEILTIFNDVKTRKEQIALLKSLPKIKQNEIELFFSKLFQNDQDSKVKKGPQSKARIDSKWYWFGYWNLVFTKAESEEIVKWVNIVGSTSAGFVSLIPKVGPILAAVLGLYIGNMNAAISLSKYGNFYIKFFRTQLIVILPGYDDGK